MKKAEQNRIQNRASRSLREILVAKKISLLGLTKIICDQGYPVSRPTVGTWIMFPHKLDFRETSVLAKALDISDKTMAAIMRGEEISITDNMIISTGK